MKRSTIFVGVVIVGLAIAFGVRIAAHQSKAAAPARTEATLISVGVATPQRSSVREFVRFSGVIRPRNEVDVSAKVGGRIEELRFETGQEVKAGQLLAVVEHVELGLQSEQAVAQVEAAEAQLLAANIQLRAAQTQQQRVATLQSGGAVAQAERDRSELGLKSAEAAVKAAEAQRKLARAASGLAARAVRNSFVSAPISGTVVKRMGSLGAQVGPGQPLLQIQDAAELKLQGAVSASEFARIVVGQPVQIAIEEMPGTTITGRIAYTSPTLDPATRRASVEVAIDNTARRILPNLFAHASVAVGERKDVLCVPTSSVVTLADGKVVFVLRGDRVKAVPLPDGSADGDLVSVEGILDETDQVVIQGQSSLTDGQIVRVQTGERS